jgi:hypothetical protein
VTRKLRRVPKDKKTGLPKKYLSGAKNKSAKAAEIKRTAKNKSVFHYDLRGAEYFNNFLHEIGYIKGDKTDLGKATFNLDLIKK